MKKVSFTILVVLITFLTSFTYAQVDVTFQVDMSEIGANPDGVSVAGNFQVAAGYASDWTPGITFLTEGDPGIYSITVQLPAGAYEFKYINGTAWGQDESVPGECAVNGNRQVVVGTDPIVLDLVCFGSCVECVEPFEVTFQVDMSEYGGTFTTPEVNGTFNNWCGACFQLEDPDGDNIWTGSTLLYPGFYEYKFAHDNWAGEESLTPGSPCTVTNFGFTNRALEVTEDVTLPVVCWESCEACGVVIEPLDVTFRVDMNQYDGTFTNVYISGEMNGWNGTANQMLDPDMDGVYETTLSLLPTDYEYKFTVDDWSDQEFFFDGQPCVVSAGGFTNRYIEVTETEELPVVCWERCVACDVPKVNVTLQVDMNNEEVSGNGVHVAGNFQNWDPGATQLTDAGNGVYTYSMEVDPDVQLVYIFINGNDWSGQESVPGECGLDNGFGGFNRYFNVSDYNDVLDLVCYGECGYCAGGTEDIFFSEYAEGDGGNNKYVEIYNGTGATVDLSNYRTHRISNGGEWDENIYPLEGMLQDGDVWVIANDGSIPEILEKADEFSPLTFFNGDDAVGLSKLVNGEWQMIDVIGTDGPDPGAGWEVAGVPAATANHTLVRKPDVCGPNADWDSSAGTDAENSEWIVYPANTWDYLGFHDAACGGSPTASAPVFSYPSGSYFESINVEITSDTPGAVIYYTTDGSEPDQSSMEYTAPVNISTDTELKAIAVAAGYGYSFVSSASYVMPTVIEVDNLAEFRALYPTDDYIKVTGEVILTYQQSFYNQKFIQDETAAVLIYDPSGAITTSYDIYDGISGLIGTIDEYGGMIELIPAQDPGAPSSTGNVLVPEIITVNEMVTNFEAYESELVQILDVTFADAGSVFANGTVYGISDASKAEGFFRTTFYNVDYIGSAIPPVPIGVTGICNSRFDGDYITSRDFNDLDIPDYILLLSPNGGEQIEQGTDFDITWESNVIETPLTIELIDEVTKASEVLAEGVPVEDGVYTWTVTQAYGDNYKISLTPPVKVLGDISDNYFSIVPPIDIKITEIMYNPPEAGSDSLEFIEFYNNGEGVVNLMDWEITQGVVYTFPEHVMNPGDYVVVAVNASAFFNTFGMEVYEWESGSLGNGGEDIELTDNAGIVRAYVDYDDGGDWYPVTDGYGPSLTFCDPSLENNDPVNWSASTWLAAVNAEGNGIYCTPGEGCNTNPVLPVWYSYGWTGISSNLEPGKMSMEDLFAPAYGNMIILLNQSGIFWPEYNINTIGDWNSYEGYKVKFAGSTYFVFSGAEVENKTFEFEAGTTFVPVLSSDPVAVDDVIVPLGDAVEFMFDINTGDVYWPAGGIVPGMTGALETLTPGFAYLTKFNASGVIDFGVAPPKATPAVVSVKENNTSWNDVIATGDQHIISLAASALETLEAGDVIGVFNAQGQCVGMANYSGEESALPLIVYGDDMTTETIDGMIEGNALNFAIYRNGSELDATAEYSFAIQNHDGLFAINGLSVVIGLKAGSTGIGEQTVGYSIYPNPGNGQFNIEIAGQYDVTVSNAQGQMVYKGQINGNAMINLSEQPEGIYFIKLTNESSTMIEKVIIR